MSMFLNNLAENNEFLYLARNMYYVDKTGLISKFNEIMENYQQRYRCITRPRRFGKSINAMMLASYYAKNLDTKEIFDGFKISKSESYLKHLNKHNVVFMTFTEGESQFEKYSEFINYFKNGLISDLKEIVPKLNENQPINKMFEDVYKQTKQGFIFIIDEWDYIFNNELYTQEERKNFLKFLTELLKDKPYVELAYMTGILPIAKHSSKSTLNMFLEFNAINDRTYENYFGFTQKEVEDLCIRQDNVKLDELEEWYNGYYTHDGEKIYSPRSVMCALENGYCDSYWVNTGKLDDIVECIQADVDRVRDDIIEMIEKNP